MKDRDTLEVFESIGQYLPRTKQKQKNKTTTKKKQSHQLTNYIPTCKTEILFLKECLIEVCYSIQNRK